ncbi:bifunctional DNA-formamidopyrimidine glycosylase/DNA-(apurinic or apyrimidinic site) lyase [Pseudodesulfovibrio tunisiensis]|uniref:bifunctional DNA-formamidopyrimidine glycosylase/DNA-(apurinic or apyrimidinic site) lyase n=1 Tax=Pseudodesulfovibrio tunisiensis TaxID=463192 RepID=UPI001FB2746E|nr:bifunctional DNA-formamidopyrimidine glycosylase/DNA-(apurinic or apyrimidinic site) lyase [Pseudodesulfovibrio tunisiensis]
MPELPEVEVIARGLDRSLKGRTISGADVPGLTRLSDSAERIVSLSCGRGVGRVYRRGKALLMELDGGVVLGFHLRMTGRIVHGPARAATSHDRIFLCLDDGSRLMFSDARKFGYVRAFGPGELESWDFLQRLGPEPLETPARELARRVASRKAGIKGLLLNQSVVAGVGNIYADESLFRAGIHPEAKADRLGMDRLERLFSELQGVLRQAIAENGSSIRDYVNADGDAGAFQNSFRVYGRKGCPCTCCNTPLQARTVAGRTSTFCPHCQCLKPGK